MKSNAFERGYLNIIISIIAIALVLGALGYVYITQQSVTSVSEMPALENTAPPASNETPAPLAPPPSTGPASPPAEMREPGISVVPAAPTDTWKTYENNAYGMTLAYPVDPPVPVRFDETGFVMHNTVGGETIVLHFMPYPVTSLIDYQKYSDPDNTYKILSMNNVIGGLLCEADAETLKPDCYASPDTKYSSAALRTELTGSAQGITKINFTPLAGKAALRFGKFTETKDATLYLVDLGNAAMAIYFTSPAKGEFNYLSDYFPKVMSSLLFSK